MTVLKSFKYTENLLVGLSWEIFSLNSIIKKKAIINR